MGANDAIPGAGDDALMIEDHSSLPIVTRLHAWAATLPSFAAEVVSRADITRPHIYTQFAAVPDQVQVARAKVTDWIQRIGLSTAQGQDVVLAADEAVSNAVDHAYPDAPAR
ncbi:Histidine kinase-like ATPase domain-containing protein [Kibdelosporangium aridum]|uniref:Histidine kinase-like ATPase domain-containing protein n=2 Tax=Kibdelosporangium aridum TaxID=2030 RepID=A0A1Y5YAD4_KIBAR|nr:Histidine kinase-like ATPase domain-containing protein [Kibdelosporangium aridum]